MSVFLVTWNLNNERSNYAQARKVFIGHLERYKNIKDSALDSVRWLSTSATTERLYEDLASKLDDNDRLFVTKVTIGNHYGWLDSDVCDWILAHI